MSKKQAPPTDDEDAPEWDWPIPFETICDTPEAVVDAVAKLREWSEATVIERDGKRVGAIISYEDFEGLQRLLWRREMELDVEAADRAKREGGRNITIQELMAELEISADA